MSRRRVLVAMSGGVDSSVAAAVLSDKGHEVVGVTLKLWGGESDKGCCSVSDVDDARRVADPLGIEHHVFNFGDHCDRHVVAPYVTDHAAGRTPNPCIECNRHVKFDRLLTRADALGFDVVATGHHARIIEHDGIRYIARGADPDKDQSYVLYMLDQAQLARVILPIGHLTKDQVRGQARRRGLRTAAKPDSQDVCFITATGGRSSFLTDRIALTPGRVVDGRGRHVGSVDGIQLVTIGQRRGLRTAGMAGPSYVTDVDIAAGTVTVGAGDDLSVDVTHLEQLCFIDGQVTGAVEAQVSAHGRVHPAEIDRYGVLAWARPHLRVAPGQSVVLYRGDRVVGGGLAA